MSDAAATAPLVEFTLIPKGALIKPETALSIEQAFAPYVEQFKELSAHVSTITDPKEAKVTRLKLQKVRTDTAKKHQELKAESLAYGRTLDHCKNLINGQIEPIEEQLEAIEKAEERRIAALLAERRQQHLAALAPYLDPTLPAPFVDGITDSQFATMLENAKTLHQAKLERQQREEKERLERERLEREERERQQAELDLLREEQLQHEEQLRKQREAADAEAKRLKDEAEAAAKKLKDAADAKLKKEREAAEKQRKEQEAKFAAEREEAERKAEYDRQVEAARQKEIDDKARREREELEQKMKAEKAKREKAEADAKAAREAEEKRLREAAEAEERRKQEEAEAIERAAAAPDREKIIAFCKAVVATPLPAVKSARAKRMVKDTALEIQEQVNMLEKLAAKL